MTSRKGNSEFCRGEHRGRGETKLTVSRGAIHYEFCYTSRLKNRKNSEENICFTPLHTLAALAKLSGCQNQAVLWKNHDNNLFLRS